MRPPPTCSPPSHVLVIITRAEAGGAQVHVRDLVLGLADRFTITVAVGEDGFLVEAVRAGGVDVRVVPALQREIAPKADRAALADLRQLIDAAEKLCFDLFAVQQLTPALYALILLKTVQTVLMKPGS